MRRLLGPTPDLVRDIDGELVIGRADADVEIADREVSRRHAAIRPVPAGVEVEDLGSSNGTFVDGQRINGKVTLTQNVTLRVGETELKVEIELPQATRISPTGIPQPADATVKRPIQRPDLIVARPQPDLPPSAPPPAGAPSPQPAPPTPQPVAEGAGINGRRVLPYAAGGVVLVAIVAVALILLLGGSSSKKKTPAATSTAQPAASTSTSAATSSTASSSGSGPLALAVAAGGALKFTASSLKAKAGKVTIQFTNGSPLSHNLTIQKGTSGAVVGATPTFQGGTKTLTVNLKPGTYTFFCSIPGHRQAGMQGTLTVS